MKRLLSTCILTAIFFAFLPTICFGTESIHYVSTVVDGNTITSANVAGDNYLFLPASTDLSNIVLNINNSKSAKIYGENGLTHTGMKFDLLSISNIDDEMRYKLIIKTDTEEFNLYIMRGSIIPTIYIMSDDTASGREWVDVSKNNQATGSMRMVSADGEIIYNDKLTQIKARGNSTFAHYPKKAYQIKLANKTDLLNNNEKNKTWVLLANYGDATMMHDKLFKDLATAIGMPYVPSCDWVNLYYDGEYRGVYLLSEKVSVGKTGVDIADMEDAYKENNSNYGDDALTLEGTNKYGKKYYYTEGLLENEDITGGWLIEKNHDYVDEACGFHTEQAVAFNIKAPEYAGTEAVKYISEYYQEFENAVYSSLTGYNTEKGKYYYEYADKLSLIQLFLIQEFGLNPDGFISSMYFYKDAGEEMYAGPLWDHDMTLGTGWSKKISTSVEDYHYLANALINIPDFKISLQEYFVNTFLPEVEMLLGENGKIEEYYKKLYDNVKMNYILWPYVRIGDPANENHFWNDNAGYDTVVKDMTDWIEKRIEVIKGRFNPEVIIAVQKMSGNGDKTTFETKADGSVVETTISKDGTKTVRTSMSAEYKENGIRVNQIYSSISTTTPKQVKTNTDKSDYEIFFDDEVKEEVVHIPVSPVRNTQNSLLMSKLSFAGFENKIFVEVPVENVTATTMAVKVYSNGQEEIIETTHSEEGISFTVSERDVIKIGNFVPAFKDVEETHWAKAAIDYTVAKGIFKGVSANTFEPDAKTTRAMVLTVLARLHGEETSTKEGESWQTPGLNWAIANGISDGTNPNDYITREQFVTILYRYAKMQGKDVSVDENTNILSYYDVLNISEWAIPAMQWATGSGIINGIATENGFELKPTDTADRATIATIFMRYMML